MRWMRRDGIDVGRLQQRQSIRLQPSGRDHRMTDQFVASIAQEMAATGRDVREECLEVLVVVGGNTHLDDRCPGHPVQLLGPHQPDRDRQRHQRIVKIAQPGFVYATENVRILFAVAPDRLPPPIEKFHSRPSLPVRHPPRPTPNDLPDDGDAAIEDSTQEGM